MFEQNKEFFRKCQFPLTMVFAANPIPLLIYVSLAPALLPFFWAIPVVCMLLMVGAFKIPGKFRMAYGVAGCVVMAAMGVAFLMVDSTLFTLLVPVTYCVLLMMSLPVGGWEAEKELPLGWYWGGLGIHAAVFFFKFFMKAVHGFDWDAIDTWLLVSFFGMAMFAVLSLTRTNLNNSANGRQKPTAFMWQKNIGLTVGFFALAMVIALVPSVYQVLEAVFDWFGELIANMMNNLKVDDFHPDNGPGGEVQPPIDQSAPMSWTDMLIQFLLNLLFYAFTFGMLGFILYWTVPKVIKGVKRIIEKLLSGTTAYLQNASEDYEDEVTDLRDTVVKQKRVRLSSSEERNLPPDQRIRYRYRRLLSKHPNWTGASTARENLPAKAAPLYEKARYSTHPITEEDAASFTSNTRRV